MSHHTRSLAKHIADQEELARRYPDNPQYQTREVREAMRECPPEPVPTEAELDRQHGIACQACGVELIGSVRDGLAHLATHPAGEPKECPHCGFEVHAPSFEFHVKWCMNRKSLKEHTDGR